MKNPPAQTSQWDQFIPRVSDHVPKGFETVAEISRRQGVSESYVARKLKRAAEDGLVESAFFRLGNRKATLHYRQKTYGKKRKS